MEAGNIIIAAGSTLPVPPAGEATLFIDTENNNTLSLKLPDGSIKIYTASNAAECCSCELAKKMMEDIGCALKDGAMTAVEYTALIAAGVTFNSTETDDGDGNKTQTPRFPVILPYITSHRSKTAGVAVSTTERMNALPIEVYACFDIGS